MRKLALAIALAGAAVPTAADAAFVLYEFRFNQENLSYDFVDTFGEKQAKQEQKGAFGFDTETNTLTRFYFYSYFGPLDYNPDPAVYDPSAYNAVWRCLTPPVPAISIASSVR